MIIFSIRFSWIVPANLNNDGDFWETVEKFFNTRDSSDMSVSWRNHPLKRDMIARMPQFIVFSGVNMVPPPIDHFGRNPLNLVVCDDLPSSIFSPVIPFLQWLLCCHRKFLLHFPSLTMNRRCVSMITMCK